MIAKAKQKLTWHNVVPAVSTAVTLMIMVISIAVYADRRITRVEDAVQAKQIQLQDIKNQCERIENKLDKITEKMIKH